MNYLATAAVELVLLSLLSGVVGTWIVLRQRSFFAVALSHATFPGGVIAAMIGVNVLIGQAVAALLLVPLMGLISRAKNQGGQVASGLVLAFGFALGALLSSLQTGMRIPVESLLVGQLFGVNASDLLVTVIALVVCLLLVLWNWRALTFDTFDPAGYRAAGFSVFRTENVIAVIVAVTVVVSMPAVGAILSVAIVVGPAATARLIAPSVGWIAPIAIIVGLAASGLGLWVSTSFGVAAGGAVGLAVAALFLVTLGVQTLRNSLSRRWYARQETWA
ncbi:MAG: metal ABC transporter permease [Canibacter sp.]